MLVLNREYFEELQGRKGLNDSELAAEMGINRVQLWRVKEGRNQPGRSFIAGALKVFPEAKFNELFFLVDELRVRRANKGGDAM